MALRPAFNNMREDRQPGSGSCLTGLQMRTAPVFLGNRVPAPRPDSVT